jgi:hypothetical protein
VQAELFKRGINILDQNDTKKLLDVINSEFQYCKTTHRHHALRR